MKGVSMNVPEIRFKGFEGEWKDFELSDIAKFSKGHGYSKSDLTSVGTPIILYGLMYTNYTTSIKDAYCFANKIENSVISQGDEIIIPASGETAEDIARASVVKPKGVILGGDLNIIRLIDGENIPEFVALSLTYGESHYKLSRVAQGKTVVHLHNSEISKSSIALPFDVLEQKEISGYYEYLDNLIQSSNVKLSSLKQTKAACLQSMFPKEGETVPKVRFKGFEGDWKLSLFSEVGNINKGEQINKKDLFTNGKYYVLNGGVEPSGYINVYNTLENTISISEGGNSCGYINFNNNKFWSGGHNYTINNLKLDSYFVYSYLKSKEYFIMSLRVGSGLPNIQKRSLLEFIIYYPSSLAEQQKIGQFFQSLDKKIELETQRLEKLKQIKSACLEKMFV